MSRQSDTRRTGPFRQRGQLKRFETREGEYWRLRLRTQPDDQGRRQQRWFNVGPVALLRTKADAWRAAEAIIASIAPPAFRIGEPVLWSIACQLYMDAAFKQLRRGTCRTYRSYIERYLVEAFAPDGGTAPRELHVHEITTQRVQLWVEQHDDYVAACREDGTACTQVKPLFNLLRSMMHFFESRKIAIGDFRPDKVRLPRDRRIRRSLGEKSFTSEQADRLVAAAGTARDRALLSLLRYLGLRISEALGLTVESIDFEASRIAIKQAAPEAVLVETKSDRSRRSLAMPPQVQEHLRSWLTECPATPEGFVFPGSKPARTLHQNVARRNVLQPLLRELGLPEHLSFHALRHTAAREFVGAGNLADASAALGHQDARLTSEYAEATDAGMRQMVLDAAARARRPSASFNIREIAAKPEKTSAAHVSADSHSSSPHD